MRKISIVILWWSRTPELEQMAQDCLNSVLNNTTYPEYDIIIIENKSIHPSKFLREFKHDKVKIYFQEENLGFVKGNNLGIKLADPNDVLLLNNDTQVPEGWLSPIMLALNSHPDCGVMMPNQIHKGSHEYAECDGDIPKILEYLKKIISKNSFRDTSSPMQNGNWLPLCATVITRLAINKVGLLDENFALGGFEDVDYSWRCFDADLKAYVVGGSAIFHHYGQSFHYHGGYAEVWVEKGKYLMEKHSAVQDSQGNVFRWADKPSGYIPK